AKERGTDPAAGRRGIVEGELAPSFSRCKCFSSSARLLESEPRSRFEFEVTIIRLLFTTMDPRPAWHRFQFPRVSPLSTVVPHAFPVLLAWLRHVKALKPCPQSSATQKANARADPHRNNFADEKS